MKMRHFAFVFLLFVFKISIAQEVTATVKIPEKAVSGGDYVVEITINKGTIKGFMKFFQGVPAGCTAVEIDSKGGSFTFADGGAKIIWITTPAESEFTISYRVNIPKDASGIKNINGKVSYILNDERKSYDLETKTIQIGSETTNETVLVTGSDRAIITSSPVLTPNEKVNPPKAPSTPAADPAPKKEEPKAPAVAETPKPVTPPPSAAPAPGTTPVAVAPPPRKEEKAVAAVPPPAPKEEKKPAATPPPASAKVPVTAIPSSNGKTFRVQIGAFTLKPKISGVPQLTTVVLDNGVTKYFSGNFATYEEAAKRKKEMIDKGFQGAFIVSFENGKMVK